MARAHYTVKIGGRERAATLTFRAPDHWYYLSPQHLWGFKGDMSDIGSVHRQFEADINNPETTTYIWFLSKREGRSGYHVVQAGIGRRLSGQGPVGNGNPPIPNDVMEYFQRRFDYWLEWQPVDSSAEFQNQTRLVPFPSGSLPTLQKITTDHPSFVELEGLIDAEQRGAETTLAATTAPATAAAATETVAALPTAIQDPPAIEVDLDHFRREQTSPHSQGFIYLIHMEDTNFFNIGMSLDPEIRLRTLQTGNPHALYLIDTREVQDMRSAESSLHRQFEGQRVINSSVREWFEFEDGADEVRKLFKSLE